MNPKKKINVGHTSTLTNTKIPNLPDDSTQEPSEMSAELKLALLKVFQNPLLVHEISQYLSFKELILCRLVDKTWNRISSSILKSRDCCRLSLYFDTHTQRLMANYFQDHLIEGNEEAPDIHDLNILLKNSKDFPATDYSLFNIENFGDPALQIFFNVNGDSIKSLTLCLSQFFPRDAEIMLSLMRVIQGILQVQCVNLEKFVLLDYEESEWPEIEEFQFHLPSLKIIDWTNSPTSFVHQIIKGCPNLQIAKNFCVQRDVDLLVELGKICTVKKYVMNGHEDVVVLTKFATGSPRLESIVCNCLGDHGELSGAFELMLKSSSGTLEQLEISAIGECAIKFPKFVKLKKLILGKNLEHRCFPRHINLDECFPVLETLDCTKVSCRFDSTFNEYFPPPDAFRGDLGTVKTLVVSVCSDLWMEKLRLLCPNFNKLIVSADHRLRLTLLRVFRLWTHLETLELRSQDERCNYATSNLDSIFTGFSVKTCVRLRAKIKYSKKKVELEKGFKQLRISRPICELKDLKELRIYFNHPLTFQGFPMSSVSHLYGFSILGNVKVNIIVSSCPPAKEMSENDLKLIQEEVKSYASVELERVRRKDD